MDGTNYQDTGSRRITAGDLPWIMSLGSERYGAHDSGGVLSFLLQALQSPTTLLICSNDRDAFLIANHVAPPWYPKQRECHVVALCTKPGAYWRGIKLLRESITWAREQGCVRWRFHSETRQDVGALCRRVGARADSPRYVLDL